MLNLCSNMIARGGRRRQRGKYAFKESRRRCWLVTASGFPFHSSLSLPFCYMRT